jgi:predicted Rossmann-fold nucleotide-binding protein
MKVIVCGGRDYDNCPFVAEVLSSVFKHERKPCEWLTIMEGGARGADALAAKWAERQIGALYLVEHETYRANWAEHGKRAGPIRNQWMLDNGPDLVIAFPGGKGTADMVKRATRKGVEVRVYE